MLPYIKSVNVLSVTPTKETPFERGTVYDFELFEKMCSEYVFNAYDRAATLDVVICFTDGHEFVSGLVLSTMQDHGVEHHLKRLLYVAVHPDSDTYWNALKSRTQARSEILSLGGNYTLSGSKALETALDAVELCEDEGCDHHGTDHTCVDHANNGVYMSVGIVKMEMVDGAPYVTVDMSDISGRHQPYLNEVFLNYMKDHNDERRNYKFINELNDKLQKALRKLKK